MLKDHKSAQSYTLSRESYQHVIKEAAAQRGFTVENVRVREGDDFSCKPAQLIITNTIDVETKEELLIALEKIKFTGLDLKVINPSGDGKNFYMHLF